MLSLEMLEIPNGCCENVESNTTFLKGFKVLKKVLDYIPPMNKLIHIMFNGTGFMYNGEIYKKSKDYVYFYLYQ